MILAVSLVVAAWAGDPLPPAVAIQAVVADDFRTVSGTIQSVGAWPGPSLFAALLKPKDDLQQLRTFPGAISAGTETVSCAGEACTFAEVVPLRFGDVGSVPRRELRANAAWYPNLAPGPVARAWEVTVRGPEGAVVVLNGTVGEGSAAWTGTTDRASLAVFRPQTKVIRESVAGGSVTFVGAASCRPVARQAVRAILEAGWPYDFPPELTVVDSNDRQRLATSGPGMVYLSDRAFRVFPGLGRFHLASVRRALYAAAAPLATTWDRAFAATALAEGLPVPRVQRLLGWAAWNPVIDQVLHDGTLPFYADAFDETFPVSVDPVLRQLGWKEPRAAALQLDDLIGEGSAATVALAAMASGDRVAAAAAGAGVPDSVLSGWEKPDPVAPDYRLSREGRTLTIERIPDAKAGLSEGLAEPVVIDTDGKRGVWLPASAARQTIEDGGRSKVSIDPDKHVADRDRSNNHIPARWNVIATGWFNDVSATQETFDVWADLVFRRSDDNRNLYLLGVEHDEQDIISAYLGYVRYLGAPVSRSAREHRLVFSGGPSVLDPAFRPTDTGAVAVGGNVAYTWDTRPFAKVQIHGHRLSVATGGGFVPGSDERWASAGTSVVQLLPVHPRHVFAVRGRASWASGNVEHRLLPIGGSDALRSLPADSWVGNERLIGQFEYRAALLRDASVPLGFGWLSEIDLVPGYETGIAWRDGEADPVGVQGVTGGVYAMVDVLGARPTLFGVSAGYPLTTTGLRPDGPQVYLSFDYAF